MKAKYLLPCSCGRQIPVEAGQAGQQIACRCGETVEVPTMRGLAQLEQATPETVRPSTSAGRPPAASEATRTPAKAAGMTPASVWGARQKILLIGALITLVGLGMAGYFFVLRPRLLDTELMAPIHSWRLWHDVRHGIDQRPDWEAAYHKLVVTYRRWMVLAFSVMGVGVLVMGSSLLAPSRRRRRRGRRPLPRGAPSRLRRAT